MFLFAIVSFLELKMFWNYIVVMIVQLCEYILETTEFYTLKG